MKTKRLAVMASGRGSNFTAVVEAIESGMIQNASIVLLLTDRPNTGAEQFARSRGIAVTALDYHRYEARDQFNEAVKRAIDGVSPDAILTLGYMRILPESLVAEYRNHIINIHPSLLPAFPGMNSQKKALEYGVRVAGATVHFIDEGVDTGPIIDQAAVPVHQEDDRDSLAARILEQEHRILIEAVDHYCNDRLRLDGRHVHIEKSK